MRKGERVVRRLCKCGCGEVVPPKFDKNGRHRGYNRYIEGHRYVRTEAQDKAFKKTRRARILPIGSRRQTHKGRECRYWEIKVAEKGKWSLEHRWIMEQHLGRKLDRSDHVHHLNGDGLDNRLENLQLLPAREHGTITGKKLAEEKKGIFKIPICPICGWRHPPHE